MALFINEVFGSGITPQKLNNIIFKIIQRCITFYWLKFLLYRPLITGTAYILN